MIEEEIKVSTFKVLFYSKSNQLDRWMDKIKEIKDGKKTFEILIEI